MCLPVAAVAGISTAASVGGQLMSFGAQKKAAAETNLYNMQVETKQLQYRLELTDYNNVNYQKDINYGGEVLAYQRGEFKRQGEHIERATDNIQKNYFAQVGTLLARMVQEDMSSAFQTDDIARQSRTGRAGIRVAADARGVEGNSVEQLLNDMSRQEGEAHGMVELNRSATRYQLSLEAMSLKASADGAIMNLPVQTYQPQQITAAPAPVSPVMPAQQVRGPSAGAAAMNMVGSLVQGANNYASWSGQSLSNAFKL